MMKREVSFSNDLSSEMQQMDESMQEDVDTDYEAVEKER